jgi:hypothetical protein
VGIKVDHRMGKDIDHSDMETHHIGDRNGIFLKEKMVPLLILQSPLRP